MSYYEDVYQKRITFHGGTKKEIILNEAEREFQQNLAESPNAEVAYVDSVETRAIILTNKSDQSKLSMEFHCASDVEVGPGAVITWDDEEWLIMSTEKFTIPAYQKSIMFRANVRVKYYNESGALLDIPGVFLGSLTSVLREAIYRQMGMAVTLDDRRAMLIVSRNRLVNNSRLILDGRAWRIVDFDSTGNRDLVYYSLQEDNIDAARDDLVSGVADAFTKAEWHITVPHSSIELNVDDTYTIRPVVTLNGVVQENPSLKVITSAPSLVVNGLTVTALSYGAGTVIVSLNDNGAVQATIAFTVLSAPVSTTSYVIVGDDSIRWGESKTYQLHQSNNATTVPVAAIFTLEGEAGAPTTLATLKQTNSLNWKVTANEATKLGNVVLRAVYDGGSYVKTVAIRSLW